MGLIIEDGRSVDLSGGIVMWSLSSWTDRRLLEQGLQGCGFGRHLPDERTKESALKSAVSEVYRNEKYLIRPLSTKDGHTVVEESRGTDENGYVTVATIKIDSALAISVTTGGVYKIPDPHVAGEVAKAFNKYLGLLTGVNIAACLVSILEEMKAVSMRPGGGVYWMPQDCIAAWATICDVIEAASVNPESFTLDPNNPSIRIFDKPKKVSNVHLIRTAMDERAIKAVVAAIRDEVIADSAKLDAEINSGELGSRAMQTRQEQAQRLHDKVVEYERILGVTLTDLSGKASDALEAATMAALTLSVANDAPVEAGV